MVQHLHHLRALAGLNTGSEFFKKGYRFLGTSSARQQDAQVRRGLDVVGVEREGLRETAFWHWQRGRGLTQQPPNRLPNPMKDIRPAAL